MLVPDDVTSFARAALTVSASPTQLISSEHLVRQCRTFHRELPQVRAFFAWKSCSNPRVVDAIDSLVEGYDVASPHEIADVVSFGVDPDRLRYSNPVKAPESIASAHRLGVTKFAAQSVQELEKIADHAPGASVYLRLRVGSSDGALDFSAKFGASSADLVAAAPRARDLGLDLLGMTFNMGSQSSDALAWSNAIGTAATVLRDLRGRGIELGELNIGGGFPVQYTADDTDPMVIFAAVRTALDGLRAEFPDISLLAEPGRFISAPSGAIVTTVIGREERVGRTWLYLDAGAFQAFLERFEFRRFLYPAHSVRHVLAGVAGPTQTYALTGPTCDSFDTLTTGLELPEGIEVGDRLLFTMAGAYTVEYGSFFNGFAPPTVLSLAGEKTGEAAQARVPSPRAEVVPASRR